MRGFYRGTDRELRVRIASLNAERMNFRVAVGNLWDIMNDLLISSSPTRERMIVPRKANDFGKDARSGPKTNLFLPQSAPTLQLILSGFFTGSPPKEKPRTKSAP